MRLRMLSTSAGSQFTRLHARTAFVFQSELAKASTLYLLNLCSISNRTSRPRWTIISSSIFWVVLRPSLGTSLRS
ncbi:hypothetical protein BO83DRAFT_245693 [Aspergillus eucalypticola CBS 122712]|uniref:Uncharacterized protein n=1 Tax=Aspergillus eucalypticola (strain CBS 122712 / IBT 29274) TaxID=1448314 RepID=A0A317VR06_ASPEC|nr:uncharacterized protein BO83DRAFT_245693 [Aspergillus eucalypticola CBS 122712]PWY75711.1 hypothetical protein BO83DRAFT_245693 [Aspergillus eucalypticola CBS 122712]